MTGEQSTFATLADLIGKPAALSLCEQFGGETIYIRKSIALDDGIWRPWGDTFGQDVAEKVLETLAGKRRLSTDAIYRISKAWRIPAELLIEPRPSRRAA